MTLTQAEIEDLYEFMLKRKEDAIYCAKLH